jgi:hypothetical protein
MLERVALHQTRLRVPGVGLDSRGVVLGARGLVLLPSLDRLVAFLAVYTEGQSLDPLVASLRIEVVRSKLGAREIALSFDAGSSDRMDRVAEVARLAGGFTFTGTTRHFVQYRDASAPFGYDAAEITATDSPLVLYHTSFSQLYGVERRVELRELLLRLTPHAAPRAGSDASPLWILAEQGLGTTLLHYLSRSAVEARCGIAEWPPETSFDDAPRLRWLFRVPALPARMRPMLMATPGIELFWPASAGAAVELGYRHPISLRAVPVFSDGALVLFRGGGPPLVIDPLPALAELGAL